MCAPFVLMPLLLGLLTGAPQPQHSHQLGAAFLMTIAMTAGVCVGFLMESRGDDTWAHVIGTLLLLGAPGWLIAFGLVTAGAWLRSRQEK